MALVGKTDTTRAIWGVGHIPSSLGVLAVGAGQGKIKEPPTSAYGSLDLQSGLSLDVGIEMKSDADATATVELGKTQLRDMAILAQASGLGTIVDQVKLDARAKVARVALTLSAKELSELEAKLDRSQGTEGASK